jgi:cytosine/adenosine deaminase-related metal-dependent hydrolase
MIAVAVLGASMNAVPSQAGAHLVLPADRPAIPRDASPTAVDTIAFMNVNVVPLDREGVLRDQSVLVHAGRIVGMGPAADSPISERVTRIEGEGRYLIPGLVDMHSHLLSDDRIADEHAGAELAVILANGVTSIRIPIGKREHLEYRSSVAAGEMIGPALYVGSPQIAGQAFGAVFNGREVKTAEQARRAVTDFHARLRLHQTDLLRLGRGVHGSGRGRG